MIGIPSSTWKYHIHAYILVVLCWIAYAALSLAMPLSTAASYHLTALQMALLRLTIIIPILVIWLVAIRGAVAFKHYASLIKGGIESTSEDERYVVTFESILPNLPQLRGYEPLLRQFWSAGVFESPERRYFRLIDRGASRVRGPRAPND